MRGSAAFLRGVPHFGTEVPEDGAAHSMALQEIAMRPLPRTIRSCCIGMMALTLAQAALAQGAGAAAAAGVGRPTIAGAQGGLGIQSGLPQGGLGTQGNDGAQVRLQTRSRNQADEPFPQGQPTLAAEARGNAVAKPVETNIEADATAKEKRATAKRVTRSSKGQVPVVR